MATVADQAYDDAIAEITAQGHAFQLADDPVDRHRAFFLRRRARAIIADPANAAMARSLLADRIANEHETVRIFVTSKVRALAPGGTDATPRHLDLRDLAQSKAKLSTSVVRQKEQKARTRRAYWLAAIAWRAAALTSSLWKAAPLAIDAVLDAAALHELVDRRLRLVERTYYQTASADALGGAWTLTGSGLHGPWLDGFRVRIFEEPRISAQPPALAQKVIALTGQAPADQFSVPFASGASEWRWRRNNFGLTYNVTPARPGPHMATGWSMATPAPNADYFFTSSTAVTLAAAVDKLVAPETDWWNRSWLRSEGILTALQLEALLFGLRRRAPQSADATFNAIPTGKPATYVALADFTAELQDKRLGGIGNGTYFTAGTIAPSDVQIGDHIVVARQEILRLLSADQPVTTQAVVVEVNSDPETGGIHASYTKLQGVGNTAAPIMIYLLEGAAAVLNEALAQARGFITSQQIALPNVAKLAYNGVADRLVRWDPYITLRPAGAWWVRIPPTEFTSVAAGLQKFPGTIAGDAKPGSKYIPPPFTDSIYFPLFQPTTPNGWTGFFDAVRDTPPTIAPAITEYSAGLTVINAPLLDGAQVTALQPRAVPTP